MRLITRVALPRCRLVAGLAYNSPAARLGYLTTAAAARIAETVSAKRERAEHASAIAAARARVPRRESHRKHSARLDRNARRKRTPHGSSDGGSLSASEQSSPQGGRESSSLRYRTLGKLEDLKGAYGYHGRVMPEGSPARKPPGASATPEASPCHTSRQGSPGVAERARVSTHAGMPANGDCGASNRLEPVSGTLHVRLGSAEGLWAGDTNRLSDPYAKLSVGRALRKQTASSRFDRMHSVPPYSTPR